MTLSTRVHLVAIIQNIGYKACYNQLLEQLQICPQSNKYFFEFIDKHDKVRRDQYARNVSAEYMRARKHKTKAKIREQVLLQRTEVDKGTYQSGIGVEDSDDNGNDESKAESNVKNKKNKPKKYFCKWCAKETTHATWRSKK